MSLIECFERFEVLGSETQLLHKGMKSLKVDECIPVFKNDRRELKGQRINQTSRRNSVLNLLSVMSSGRRIN